MQILYEPRNLEKTAFSTRIFFRRIEPVMSFPMSYRASESDQRLLTRKFLKMTSKIDLFSALLAGNFKEKRFFGNFNADLSGLSSSFVCTIDRPILREKIFFEIFSQ